MHWTRARITLLALLTLFGLAAGLIRPLYARAETYDNCFPQAGCQRVTMPADNGDAPASCIKGETFLKGVAGAGNCTTVNNSSLCVCTSTNTWKPFEGIFIANAGALPDPYSWVLGTTTGFKLGTATTQKLGFWNTTPITQPTGTAEVIASLQNEGLLASGNHTLTVPGALTASSTTALNGTTTIGEGINVVLGTTTGSKVGTATTQKLGFFNATPIVQPVATVSIADAFQSLGLGAAPAASQAVPLGPTPAAQTIAGGDTIAADACGSIKQITAAGGVTTNTTDTFTAPATTNKGCVMAVCNTGAQNIVLDNNAHFKSAAAGDVTLGADDCVSVASTGTVWYQVSALLAN